jgi:hypothetical protein
MTCIIFIRYLLTAFFTDYIFLKLLYTLLLNNFTKQHISYAIKNTAKSIKSYTLISTMNNDF